jgi:hypothetical protein
MVRRRKERLHVFFHHIRSWPKSKALVKRLQAFFRWIKKWPKENKKKLHVFLWVFEMAKRIDEEVASFFHGI